MKITQISEEETPRDEETTRTPEILKTPWEEATRIPETQERIREGIIQTPKTMEMELSLRLPKSPFPRPPRKLLPERRYSLLQK
ncbi:MAG: hypothetical protein PUA75_00575 [Clostridiales bacterium]|nr:hypothetical protein [Clostridiales bacterium]